MGSRAARGGLCPLSILVPVALALLAVCGCTSALPRGRVCPRPPVPKNGGFRCFFGCRPGHDDKQFGSGSVVEYYCDGGYTLGAPMATAVCSQGKWNLQEEIICRLSPGNTGSRPPSPRSGVSVPLVGAVAFTISGLLLIAMVCVLVKPKHRSCQCGSGDYSRMVEPDLLSEDGCPLPLPSYEEAVYGSQGCPLPQTLSRAPLALILAEDAPAASPGTGGCTPPPSYEEVQGATGDTALRAGAGTLLSTQSPFSVAAEDK